MNPIAIVIPTLNEAQGRATGELALLHARCEARLIVVGGPPRGFTKTVNEGLRQTTTEDVCILNDDVTWFPYGWLSALRAGLYANGRYGIAGPGGKSATAPARNGKLGMYGLEECRQLPFWCVLLRRAMIDEIGILDERFIHYASDNEYCARALKHGWRCVWVRGVWLRHDHHGSGRRKEWKRHDAKLLRKVL